MKKTFVKDLLASPLGAIITLCGWIQAKRHHGKVVFLTLCDSTGHIQAVAEQGALSDKDYATIISTNVESAVEVGGIIVQDEKGRMEIKIQSFKVIGNAAKPLYPQPRGPIDIFNADLASQLLGNRHLYIRNPKLMAMLQFRNLMLRVVHQWFAERDFTEITAPVLTSLPLYDDGSALSTQIDGKTVYLTQCVGFYLEAAVHAFERVYNMGPSFRGEESRSKRHLMEYWHIKAEMAWVNIEDLIGLVEAIINDITIRCQAESDHVVATLGTTFCTDGCRIPFPRISYVDAVETLKTRGFPDMQFGKSLGTDEEVELSKDFDSPFWVTGIPRTIEPFPYVIDRDDPRVTRTADLICSNGYGELLGIAEKIHDAAMLEERMKEKGKNENPNYEWLKELRHHGCVPHGGFGMGLERLIRWLLNVPHVRDAMPFPRIFRRTVLP